MALKDTLAALFGTAWHTNHDAIMQGLADAIDASSDVTPGTVAASKEVVVDANKHIDTLGLPVSGLKIGTSGSETAVTASAAELNTMTGILATAAELNRIAHVSTRVVSVATSPLTADLATHEGKTVALNLATGIAVTLPASTGGGAKYKFVIGTANSSTNNYTIATAPTTDIFQGSIYAGTDNGAGAGFTWPASSNSNKLTLGGTSHATGGSVGDTIEVEDIAAGVWAVRGQITQGGTEATPYSHV